MTKNSRHIISVCGHIGTHKYNWQPESERFAIGYRSSILIYNISVANFYINRALSFAEALVQKYGRIYIYGLNVKNDKKIIQKFEDLNQVVTTKNWCGGYVTNARAFRGKIKNLKKKFSAILGLNYDYNNYSLPRESKIINLPAIGVVDSNANAESFNYPIPINSTNFGVTRLLAYAFSIKIFKGLSKRIIGRFRKIKSIYRIINKKKIKRRRKLYLRLYFKKIKRSLRAKKKRFKRWLRRAKFRKARFKEKALRLTKEDAKRDYFEHNGEIHVSLEAAAKTQALYIKIRRCRRKKIKANRRLKKKPAKPKRIPPHISFGARQISIRKKLAELDNPTKKFKSYIRFRGKRRRIYHKNKNVYDIIKPKKKVAKKRKKKRKNKRYRYRPNKKWKPRLKPKKKVINKFNRIKKKIKLLSKKNDFEKLKYARLLKKNPKFIYRIVKADIYNYKVKKIYKFLYRKKKRMLLRRAREKRRAKKNKGKLNYYDIYNKQNVRKNSKQIYYKSNNSTNTHSEKKEKNYRYYYKDFAYVKKPKKK